jgi:hypothetical protein
MEKSKISTPPGWNLIANLDLEVRYSGRVHNAALYRSARPDLWIRIHHCSNPETSSGWQVTVPTAMLEVCRPSQMFIQ